MNSHLVSLLWWFGGAAQRRPLARSAWSGWWWLCAAASLPAPALAVTPSAAQLSNRVEAAARQYVIEQAVAKGLVDPVVELRSGTSTTPLPPCNDNVTVEALDTRTSSRMRFAAVCTGPDGWQREWTVRAELSAKVVVAMVDVPANRVLAEADLGTERRRVPDLADVLADPSQAVGQTSTRAVRSGQPVQPRWLTVPMLVKRGESVVILARTEGIEVQAAGEALEAGRLRDVVRVRNVTTGKVIRARVIETGTVEPESMGGSSRP